MKHIMYFKINKVNKLMQQSLPIFKIIAKILVIFFTSIAALTFATTTNKAAQATKIMADASKGEIIYTKGLIDKNVPACMNCHGANGNSGGGENPKLAGQHSGYIIKQMANFKDKTQRKHAVMSPIAMRLNEEDIANIAAYLSAQKIKVGASKTEQSINLGQKIYRGGISETKVPACASCHSPNGAGIPSQYPRLGGQSYAYVKGQMQGFKNNTRNNSTIMSEIAIRMTDKEIEAVSDYISGLH